MHCATENIALKLGLETEVYFVIFSDGTELQNPESESKLAAICESYERLVLGN